MGRVKNSRRRTSKNKQFKKSVDTKRRPRDVDQIQDDIKKAEEAEKKMEFEFDEDLPGMGQHYCTECARHFSDEGTLEIHTKSKDHKRRSPTMRFRSPGCNDLTYCSCYYRLRTLAEEQYTQAEAERAAGKTKEVLPPAHGERKEIMDSAE
jgi:hypothetical protein